MHEAATQYFEQSLHSPEAARAREYLTLRGVTAETIKTFRLGYAPESFNDMRDRLGKFFPEDVLRASGLFSAKDQADGSPGPMYARFRKRITFPIANEQGKPIAFTARALDGADVDPKAGPKYMNSPETALYTKGQVLFNLDKAKTSIRQLDIALLVEGQMDCISVFMGGIANVLATSGTAFTEQQVRLLSRFTKRVVLNFDPDQAGANAAEKTISLLVEEGFEVRVVTLEGGLDPDRFIKDRGMAAYSEAVRAATRYADYLIERARTLFPGRTAELKVKALNFLLPHIRRVPNAIARAEFADNAAQKLGIESSLVRQELKQAAQQRLESVKAAQPQAVSELERILLCALVLPEADSARPACGQPAWRASRVVRRSGVRRTHRNAGGRSCARQSLRGCANRDRARAACQRAARQRRRPVCPSCAGRARLSLWQIPRAPPPRHPPADVGSAAPRRRCDAAYAGAGKASRRSPA